MCVCAQPNIFVLKHKQLIVTIFLLLVTISNSTRSEFLLIVTILNSNPFEFLLIVTIENSTPFEFLLIVTTKNSSQNFLLPTPDSYAKNDKKRPKTDERS